MSGGTMDNAWSKVKAAADEVERSMARGGNHPVLRQRVAEHLEECAKVLRKIEWADSADTGPGDWVAAADTLLGSRACTRRETWAAERIAERIAAAAASSAMPEHTVVIGTTGQARRQVLNSAAERATGPEVEIVKLEGARLEGTGPNAIWRAAADALRGPAKDEDTAPLARLLASREDADGAVAILVHDLDALIARWRERDDIWTLRHTMQNEPRIVLACSCAQWPPAGTSGCDSGAYGSFSVQQLDG